MDQRGFTLLEVMISLAILAGVVAALAASLNYHLGVVAQNRDIMLGTMLGREKTGEWGLLGLPPAPEGAFPPPFEKFSWTVARKDLKVMNVVRLDLKVSWKEGDVSFVSFRQER
ncbi:MAG: prepilin-type N-terminal cleavage/methylation domain-containing protein [Deltaproteobacteria bacterium]|nr:prepilin-type N-terminal cleavage/methylation domain-containing protein [Deltaproteobacteria bacterium]